MTKLLYFPKLVRKKWKTSILPVSILEGSKTLALPLKTGILRAYLPVRKVTRWQVARRCGAAVGEPSG
jgi:hypothetical protein